MSIAIVGGGPRHGVTWIDVVEPTAAELDAIARDYGLHHTSVRDCLDPEHLPKWERFPTRTFLIIRVFDAHAGAECATVHEMTRKLAVFAGPDFVVTIHRKPLDFVTALRARWEEGGLETATANGLGPEPHRLVFQLLDDGLETYLAPLERAEEGIDAFEEALFERRQGQAELLELYRLRRRMNVMKRMLWRGLDVVRSLAPAEQPAPAYQDLREHVESLHFYADELTEYAGSLMSLQLAMASQRTNDVMRVLTVFSAFFLPLTFLVGVYGMNFDVMPELRWRLGYPLVWAVMIAVTAVIFAWFRRRGWLQR